MRVSRQVAAEDVTVHTPEDCLPEEPEVATDRLGLLGPRAQRALRLGLSAKNPGFHVYVACDPDLLFDKDVVLSAERAAAQLPAPNDVVYVHDFDHPEAPKPLLLPAGRGRELAELVEKLIDTLGRRLQSLAATPVMRDAQVALGRELASKNKQVVSDLESFAKSLGFGVRAVPGGVQTFPILHGKPVSSEQFEVLDESTKRTLNDAELKLSSAVEDAAKRIHELTDEVNAASDDAMQRAAEEAIAEEMELLREAFGDLEGIGNYLEQILHQLVHDWQDLIEPEPEEDDSEHDENQKDEVDHGNPEIARRTGRFRVNV
ncbi:MAG: AAA family ATPase, partial [Polyangiaceae bacterium]|nr:AAA family ATPase [Polyangiaceae bacterium]